MSEYTQQALDFAKKYGVKFSAEFLRYDYHFEGDEDKRDIYRITLERNGEKWQFEFGQSLAKSIVINVKGDEMKYKQESPSLYDVLSCIEKNDVGTFENFCSEFGYNDQPLSAYPKVKKAWKAVKKEFKAVERLFSDCIEELQEIS